jgi:hypothetical protein
MRLFADISCDERTVYISLLSGILGYFLPNPKISSKKPVETTGD